MSLKKVIGVLLISIAVFVFIVAICYASSPSDFWFIVKIVAAMVGACDVLLAGVCLVDEDAFL